MEKNFKMAYRKALLREVDRLKSVMNERELSGMDVHPNLLSKIYADVCAEFKGLVPDNSHELCSQVIEQLVKEKAIFRYENVLRVQ